MVNRIAEALKIRLDSYDMFRISYLRNAGWKRTNDPAYMEEPGTGDIYFFGNAFQKQLLKDREDYGDDRRD